MQKLQLVIISVFLAKHVMVMNYKSCQCANVTLLGAVMKAGVHFFDMCHFHSPDAADSTSFDVQLGDIILTATDGLFDNMPDYMILQELKKLKVSVRDSEHTRLLPPLTVTAISFMAFVLHVKGPQQSAVT